MTIEHFGEVLRPGKYGFRISRELYAIPNKKPSSQLPWHRLPPEYLEATAWQFEDDSRTAYSDEFCQAMRQNALVNFDLNMAFFDQLDADDFEASLQKVLIRNPRMRPVTNLRDYDGDTGVYLMVLDEYKQVYVGQTVDIRRRIRQHWAGVKAFDRLLWGSPDESVLSISSFRALDTARLFAARTINTDSLESRLVRKIPPQYLLNRIGGGKPDALRLMFVGLEMHTRQLVPLDQPPAAHESSTAVTPPDLAVESDTAATLRPAAEATADPRNIVHLGLDGLHYEVELSQDKAAQLRTRLQIYIDHARPIRPAPPAEDSAAIRAWAVHSGFAISPRGRLRKDVIEAYRRAHAPSDEDEATNIGGCDD